MSDERVWLYKDGEDPVLCADAEEAEMYRDEGWTDAPGGEPAAPEAEDEAPEDETEEV